MMRSLKPSSHPWVVIAVALALVVFSAAAFIPGPWHEDEKDSDCFVCKIGHHALTPVAAAVEIEPPATPPRYSPLEKSADVSGILSQPSVPRAPPA